MSLIYFKKNVQTSNHSRESNKLANVDYVYMCSWYACLLAAMWNGKHELHVALR